MLDSGLHRTLPFAPDSPDLVHLRVIETTDLHVHVYPYDYYADRPAPALGLACSAELIAALRAEAPNALLFDNGDFLQGSPLGDHVAQGRRFRAGDLHPVVAGMNTMGYDAVTLGNHEFNYGLTFLARALARAAFPVVSANAVIAGGGGRTLVPPFVLLDRVLRDGHGRPRRLRIGVTGFLPPQTAQWDRDHLAGRVETPEIVATARALVPRMRAAGADLVIALAHSGIAAAGAEGNAEHAATALAALEGIDVVLAGHAHLLFPSPAFAGLAGVDVAAGRLCGKPAVMAGCYGSHVGVVDLALAECGGRWRIVASRSSVPAVAQHRLAGRRRPGAPAVLAAARRGHSATLRRLRAPIGHSAERLCTHLALIADTAAVRFVAAAKAEAVGRALAGTIWGGLPVLAAVAPFKAGGRGGPGNYTDIPPGPLARRHVADLYPFPNTLRAVLVDGQGLRDWLDRSAALFRTLGPDSRDAPLVDPALPSYLFDSVPGLHYRIDLSRPPRFDGAGRPTGARASRIRDLRFGGAPVSHDARFVVATNSFRLAVRLAMPGPAPAVVLAREVPNRDLLAAWVAAAPGPLRAPGPGWRLDLPPGASAVFETAPGALDGDPAADGAADLGGLRLTPLGLTEAGFLRLRVTAG